MDVYIDKRLIVCKQTLRKQSSGCTFYLRYVGVFTFISLLYLPLTIKGTFKANFVPARYFFSFSFFFQKFDDVNYCNISLMFIRGTICRSCNIFLSRYNHFVSVRSIMVVT